MQVNLQMDEDSGYIEDASVNKLEGGILNNPEMVAQISEKIVNSVYGENDMRHPIEVNLLNDDVWSIADGPLPEGMTGGGAMLMLQRSNSMIIL